jgi:hypothetical protein
MKIIDNANYNIGWSSNGNKRISLYRRKSLEDWQFQKGVQWWAVQMKWELGCCWFLLRYWLKLSLAFLDEENNEDINPTKNHQRFSSLILLYKILMKFSLKKIKENFWLTHLCHVYCACIYCSATVLREQGKETTTTWYTVNKI